MKMFNREIKVDVLQVAKVVVVALLTVAFYSAVTDKSGSDE